MNHQEMFNTIDAFINNHFYQYAIMINGEWGSGKTYFIKNELIPHLKNKKYKDTDGIEKEKDLNYISLYGIKETSDISNILCSQAIEDKIEKVSNKTKIYNILGKKELIKSSSKSFHAVTLATDVLAKLILKKTELGDEKDLKRLLELFPNFDNNIIIFDDLERCSCSVNDVLGFINNFVEHSSAKVIVVANENEIGNASIACREMQMIVASNEQIKIEVETQEEKDKKLVLGNEYRSKDAALTPEKVELRRRAIFDENEEYRRIKEKVIGDTITYEPELKSVFLKLVSDKISNMQLVEALQHEIDNLVAHAVNNKHKNLRTFQFFLEKIDKVFCAIDNKFLALHLGMINYCYRSSINWKAGKRIQPNWEDEEYGYQRFGESEFSSDYIFGYRFIDTLIRDGNIDINSVNETLTKYERKIIEEGQLSNDPYQRIKNWYISEDEEVEQWINGIIDNINNDVYSTALYPELIHRLSYIRAYGLFVDLVDKALNTLEKHFEKMDHSKVVPFAQERFIVEKTEGAIFREHMDKLQKIMDEKEDMINREEYQHIFDDKNSNWTNDILDIIRKDRVLKGWSFVYWIAPEVIIERLKNSSNKEIDEFRHVLGNLYDSSLYYKHKEDDYNHLYELKKQIKEIDTSFAGEIKKKAYKWTERDLEQYLRRYSQYQPDTTITIDNG